MQEAVAQYQLMRKDPDAEESLRKAISAAEQCGLRARAETLRQNYGVQGSAGARNGGRTKRQKQD
jgi:hypothetical protein